MGTRIRLVRGSEAGGGPANFAAAGAAHLGADGTFRSTGRIIAGSTSRLHHHGPSEIGVYVHTGQPVFLFHDGDVETGVEAGPGDYVFIPPGLPHREHNPDPDHDVQIVVAASTSEVRAFPVDGPNPA